MEHPNNPKQATFNAGMIQVSRLGNQLNLANEYVLEGNLVGWYHVLQMLYKEVSPKLGKEDIKDYQEWQAKIIPAFNAYRMVLNNRANEILQEKKAMAFHAVLFDYEVWLRCKLDKAGMGNPDASDPSRALGRG